MQQRVNTPLKRWLRLQLNRLYIFVYTFPRPLLVALAAVNLLFTVFFITNQPSPLSRQRDQMDDIWGDMAELRLMPMPAHPFVYINSTGRRGEKCIIPAGKSVVWSKTEPPFQIVVHERGTDAISDQIRETGVWDAASTQTIGRLFSHSTFVDVGAGIGFLTLWAAMTDTYAIAFEPLPIHAEMIAASACLNGLSDKVELYQIGVMRKNDTCVAYMHPNATSVGARIACLPEKVVQQWPHTIVDVDSLSEYLREIHVDLMRIDVNGVEQAVMEGGMSAFRDPWTGPPRQIIFQCDRPLAQSVGLDVVFWRKFAFEFNCKFDHSRHVHVSEWFSNLGWVNRAILGSCAGSTHVLHCPEQAFRYANRVSRARFD